MQGLCGEQRQYLMQFDVLETTVMGLQVRAFKNCNKWTSAYRLWKMKKFIF